MSRTTFGLIGAVLFIFSLGMAGCGLLIMPWGPGDMLEVANMMFFISIISMIASLVCFYKAVKKPSAQALSK